MEQGEGGGHVSVQEGEKLVQERNKKEEDRLAQEKKVQEEEGSKLSVESLFFEVDQRVLSDEYGLGCSFYRPSQIFTKPINQPTISPTSTTLFPRLCVCQPSEMIHLSVWRWKRTHK